MRVYTYTLRVFLLDGGSTYWIYEATRLTQAWRAARREFLGRGVVGIKAVRIS